MTHWRDQHEHGIAQMEKLEARFQTRMGWFTVAGVFLLLFVWWVALP